MNVRATPEGLLYLHVERNTTDTRYWLMHLGDFPRRVVEVSATDADSSLKVYREVTVVPPDAPTGCGDYGVDTPDAFTCLFLRELLPAGQADDLDEARLRAKLPRLVQDSSSYRLVFAEEFNGTPPAAHANGCSDGLSTLDAAVWNYADACVNLDSKKEACGNVGHIPLPIALSSWGYLDSANPYIRSRIKFDYIRVWQPENHYADMETVYQ